MSIMNLAEIMDRSIDILKKYVKTIIMFSLGYGVVMFGVLFVFMILAVIFIAVITSLLKNVAFTVVMVSILCFVVIAFSLTANIGIIKIASQEFFEERIYASNAVATSFKSSIKVFGITFIALLLFIPSVAIFSVPIYLIYRMPELAHKSIDGNFAGIAMVIAVIICVLYVLAAVAVVIGYITMFSFSLQALVIEKTGVIGSIKRSFNLVKHNFAKIYGCMVLFGITTYIIRYSLMSLWALVISIIFMILKFINLQQNYTTFLTMAFTYSNWPISLVSWCIISPIGTIMISLLYFNQRFKKEGFDMVLRLKEIQKSQEREQLNGSIEFNKSL